MHFWKYQGAGNDFVMLDQREHQWLSRADTATIAWLCDRRFGIGADGLILLQHLPGYDFEMIYFNADGRESTMCGNGGRCIAAFAQDLGVVKEHCHFWAIDGAHEAWISKTILKHGGTEAQGAIEGAQEAWSGTAEDQVSWVELKMSPVPSVERSDNNTFVLNTGSPHYVRFVEAVEGVDMVQEGRAVRYSDRFRAEGINVNLVRADKDLHIRTYERGVEDETLACGTGVTAAAIAHYLHSGMAAGQADIPVHAQGGDLSVRFQANADGSFSEIWLCGPAAQVFEGSIDAQKTLHS